MRRKLDLCAARWFPARSGTNYCALPIDQFGQSRSVKQIVLPKGPPKGVVQAVSIGKSLPKAPPPSAAGINIARGDGTYSDINSGDQTSLSIRLLRLSEKESPALRAKFPSSPTTTGNSPDPVNLLRGLLPDVVPLSAIIGAKKFFKFEGWDTPDKVSDTDLALKLYTRYAKAEARGLCGIEWHPSVGSMCRLRGGGGAGAGVIVEESTLAVKPIQVAEPMTQVEELKRLVTAHPDKAEFLFNYCFVWLRPHAHHHMGRFGLPGYKVKAEDELIRSRAMICDIYRLARTMQVKEWTHLQQVSQRCQGEPLLMPGGYGRKTAQIFTFAKKRFEREEPITRDINPLQIALQYPQYFGIRWENPTQSQLDQGADPQTTPQHCFLRYNVWEEKYCPHHNVGDQELKQLKDEAVQAYSQFKEEQNQGEKFKHAEVRNLVKLRHQLNRSWETRKKPCVFQDHNVLAFYIFDLLPEKDDAHYLTKEQITEVMREDCLRGMEHTVVSKKELRAYHNLFRISEFNPPKWGIKRRDLPLTEKDIAEFDLDDLTTSDVKDMLLAATNNPKLRHTDPRNRGDIGTLMGFLPSPVRKLIKTKWGGISAICDLHRTVFVRDEKDYTWRVRVMPDEEKRTGQ